MFSLVMISDVQAARIYKSIDAAGNVTYSSTPPADAIQTQQIILPAEGEAATSTSDNVIIDKIKSASEGLEKDRKVREAERESARKKLQDEEAARQAQKPPEVIHHYPAYSPYWPGGYPPPGHRPPPYPPTRPPPPPSRPPPARPPPNQPPPRTR